MVGYPVHLYLSANGKAGIQAAVMLRRSLTESRKCKYGYFLKAILQ